MLDQIKKELEDLSNPERAKKLSSFFKTGKGQYGEGDIFLGIPVPNQRKLAKKYRELPLNEISILLSSKIHEHRLTALLILVLKYNKSGLKEKEMIFNFYLKKLDFINNWDLVDLSAPKIIGDYLLNRERSILNSLIKSSSLWERRIAVLATLTFIRNGDFKDALKIFESLILDEHDLIHKAVGWMLREIGKRNQQILEEFLNEFFLQMPRTMLRYSIEKLEPEKRKYYLNRKSS